MSLNEKSSRSRTRTPRRKSNLRGEIHSSAREREEGRMAKGKAPKTQARRPALEQPMNNYPPGTTEADINARFGPEGPSNDDLADLEAEKGDQDRDKEVDND